MTIKSRIRTIPDHPKPGVQFRDITTLLQDAVGLRIAVEGLTEAFRGERIDKVAGIEARGFVLGGAVALALGAGFVMVRKPGKLPGATVGHDYQLVLLLDDLIATGGTAEAAIRVIEQLGGEMVGVGVVIDLPDLGGRARLEALGHRVVALCAFEGE